MTRTFALLGSLVVLLAGCSADPGERRGGQAEEATPSSSAPADPAGISLSPGDGAADVSPITPLEISVTGGELADVELLDGDGAAVPGAVEQQDGEDGAGGELAVWTPEEPLAYGTGYTLTATATNPDAEEARASAAFTTVAPDALFHPAMGPLDGQVVGVGMPVRVFFDQPVPDDLKAGVERNLGVQSSTPTDGVWSWLSDTEVHFRPSEYWPANTDVTVEADLYGVEVADGVWGETDRTIEFSIGDRHVSVADATAHTMEVYDGDELVQTFPISAGGPRFPSRNGPHVVTEMNRDRVMDSSTYGTPVDSPDGYRTPVEYAVRLSNSGEFVHAAPWSVADQGRANVSHGCINLSTERAAWFFAFTQPGDVVEIVGSEGPALSAAETDIPDWTIPWEQWRAGSALR